MQVKLTNWKLIFDDKTIPAQVPGDITVDLYRAGIVKDPYFGLNYKEIEWVARRDFTYQTVIVADDELLQNESVSVVFDGIDVFSDVYLNGKHLGETKNMFLQYRFEIRPLLQKGNNVLTVEMHSTLNIMDKIDTTGYYAIFNEPRMFVRKAQCHFGWDWAPKICAYGIWNNVYVEGKSKQCIDDVFVVADDKGNLTLSVTLNYNINATYDTLGVMAPGSYEENLGDKLHYYVSETPFAEPNLYKGFDVIGKRNFACFVNKQAQLWWPLGYGEQPLYNYRVELERDGKIISVKSGRFGYRSVRLLEEPKADTLLGYQLQVNGVDVFVKGSNWIPVECFTGEITDDKYRKLTKLAANGNFNMLRVWGGGIYEKDIFYDLCDELGIMVWQDMMLACAEIAEDKPEWVSNMLAEVEYQVKRLRNHPALVYWCGGNEKTGCYGLCITKGEFFTDVTIATVDSNGVVTAVAVGETTIKATTGTERIALASVTVLDNSFVLVPCIEINETALNIAVGGEYTLQPQLTYGGQAVTGTISWTSTNPSVATVENGIVKAVGNGSATVVCQASYEGQTTTAKVGVTVAESGYYFCADYANLEIWQGDTVQLSISQTVNGETTQIPNVEYKSSSTYATITASGQLTVKKGEDLVITATFEHDGTTYTCETPLHVYGKHTVKIYLLAETKQTPEFTLL